jgi:hypothetical protein
MSRTGVRSRVPSLDGKVRAIASQILSDACISVQKFNGSGWRIYVTDTCRGRCSFRSKTITIPRWACDPTHHIGGRPGYLEWYVAHELAHYLDRQRKGPGCRLDHGPSFQAALKELCPPHAIHHELGYKPRRARAAGIREPAQPQAPARLIRTFQV